MSAIFALLIMVCFVLFLAQKTKLPVTILPFVILTATPLWLLPFGMANLLVWGGVFWVLLGLAAIGYLSCKNQLKSAIEKILQPALLCFFVASLVMFCVFAVQNPMFIQWDEFTFWGTAIQRTLTQDVLHPVATGYLAAPSYPPSLMLLSYIFGFLSADFTEWHAYFAYSVLMFSVFCAMCGCLKKTAPWYKSVLFFCTALAFPLLFWNVHQGFTAYLTTMSDAVLGLVFGGAICIYFAVGKTKTGIVALALNLAFLTLIKEIGLAYAFVVVGIAFVDTALATKPVAIKNFKTAVVNSFVLGVSIVAPYIVWTSYIAHVTGVDKTVVGNETAGTVVGYGFLLKDGILQFLGMGSAEYSEKFLLVARGMFSAFFDVKIGVLGAGIVYLTMFACVFVAMLIFAKNSEVFRRGLWFAVASTGAFICFVVFHLLLYVYNFSNTEALVLKDYSRYISPYYMGWFVAIMCVLGGLEVQKNKKCLCDIFSLCLCVGVLGVTAVFGLPNESFWNFPHERYIERLQIKSRAELANGFLLPEDTVLLISQGDSGTRWYYYGYELDAELALGYGGENWAEKNSKHWLTTFSTLVSRDDNSGGYSYTAKANAEDLNAFLQEQKYTHVLIDVSDEYIATEFAELFKCKAPDSILDGAVLYKVSYEGEGVLLSELVKMK